MSTQPQTDCELLVLAAKAAGIEHAICYEAYPEDGFPYAYAKTGKRTYWNPFANSGDAFQLAFDLKINVIFAGGRFYVGPLRYGMDICCEGTIETVRYAIVVEAAKLWTARQQCCK